MADPHECGLIEAVHAATRKPGVEFAVTDPECFRDGLVRGIRFDPQTRILFVTGAPLASDAMPSVNQFAISVNGMDANFVDRDPWDR